MSLSLYLCGFVPWQSQIELNMVRANAKRIASIQNA
jgi:hypothetical protein